MSNVDLRNCLRGKCSCGKCDEFFLPNPEGTNGWCVYCNHPPVEHDLLRKPELSASLLPVAESVGETSSDFYPQHETQEVQMLHETPISFVNSSTDIIQRPVEDFSLPEFSYVLQPLLNGDVLSERDHARLSSILKEELISFLNRENLLSIGNTSTLRWGYRNLGKTLALKYPQMLWDSPSHRQKKIPKENAPIYSVFIRRLSQRRKMQRLREKAKEEKVNLVVDVADDDFEVSPEDAVSELKSVTSETVRNNSNSSRIIELLKISYEIRQKEDLSELPTFLMAQTYLETEVELRLGSSMAAMETKLLGALEKMSAAYFVPGTILELEKLMQPKRATWSAITMGEYSSEQKRPGPSIFFGKEKILLIVDQAIHLDATCSLEHASILLLGIYFILNLNFPAAYGQFLGLLQNVLVERKKFPKQFSSNHLLQVTKNVI